MAALKHYLFEYDYLTKKLHGNSLRAGSFFYIYISVIFDHVSIELVNLCVYLFRDGTF